MRTPEAAVDDVRAPQGQEIYRTHQVGDREHWYYGPAGQPVRRGRGSARGPSGGGYPSRESTAIIHATDRATNGAKTTV